MLGQNKEQLNSTIGENSFFRGSFSIKDSIRIDGKYEGEYLEATHIAVGPKAKVKTNMEAQTVIVEGIVIGNIKAENRLILFPTSKILGNIETPELIIQNGVVLEGNCKIITEKDEGQSPKDIIEKLYEE